MLVGSWESRKETCWDPLLNHWDKDISTPSGCGLGVGRVHQGKALAAAGGWGSTPSEGRAQLSYGLEVVMSHPSHTLCHPATSSQRLEQDVPQRHPRDWSSQLMPGVLSLARASRPLFLL